MRGLHVNAQCCVRLCQPYISLGAARLSESNIWMITACLQVARSYNSEFLPRLYAKSVLVDLMAVSSAWVSWAVSMHRQGPDLEATCGHWHRTAVDTLSAALAAEREGGNANVEDAYGSETESNGQGRQFSAAVGPGVVAAGVEVAELSGAQVEDLRSCPWGADAVSGAVMQREIEHIVPLTLAAVAAAGPSFTVMAAAGPAGSQTDGGSAGEVDGGAADAAARPRREARSPSGVPPRSEVSAGAFEVSRVLSSLFTTPRDRAVRRRRNAASAADSAAEVHPEHFGRLEPQHPVLRPVALTCPGVVIGSLLPNEAQQHLTLTQQDGTEPQWRGAELEAAASAAGYRLVGVVDSRLGPVVCTIVPRPPDAPATWPHTGSDDGSASIPAAAAAALASQLSSPPGSPPSPGHVSSDRGGIRTVPPVPAMPSGEDRPAAAQLRVCSLVGCKINGRHLPCGATAALRTGDRITLVPNTSLAFVFIAGDPSERTEPPHASVAAYLPSAHVPICQLCGGLPRKTVELDRCGHTFCAPCLSHHFAKALEAGMPVECPHGCPESKSILECSVADTLVRNLPADVAYLSRAVPQAPVGPMGDAATPAAGTPRSPAWGHCVPCSPRVPHPPPPHLSSPRSPAMRHEGSPLTPSTPRRCHRAELPSPRGPFSPPAPSPPGPRPRSAPEPYSPASPASSRLGAPSALRPESLTRPATSNPLVPLDASVLPLSMHSLHTQQIEISARRLREASVLQSLESLQVAAEHMYPLAHGALTSQARFHSLVTAS